MGLAIFTKVPAFTMVIPIGYLILSSNKTESNTLRTFSLWLAPIILIPLIWPMSAISVGQFDNWLFGIYEQANREKLTLSLSIKDLFQIDPILLILGIAGIIFAAVRKDFFIILFIVPYTLFLNLVGFVTIFHLLPLIVGFSIASGTFITYGSDILQKIALNNKLIQVLPYVIITGISIAGLTGMISTSGLLKDHNSHYFDAVRVCKRIHAKQDSLL